MIETKKIYINPLITQSQILKPHIITSKILENKDYDIILSIDHEGWDLVSSGVENLVKEICDYNNIDYKKIKFESSNYNPNLKYFNHIQSLYTNFRMISIPNTVSDISNNKYGLFLGRPSNERLYAFLKHTQWNHGNLGLATFHFNPMDINEFESEFTNFLIQHNEGWKNLRHKLPYSDFGNRLTYPIVRESHGDTNFWTSVYKKISTEIVCETVVQNKSFFITEKTIRPILYKRLFLTIASKSYEKKLKELGFDIFDDIIDKTYDSKNHYDRVEHVYGSLDQVLRNFAQIKNSKDIIKRLEKNRQRMIDYVNEQVNLINKNK